MRFIKFKPSRQQSTGWVWQQTPNPSSYLPLSLSTHDPHCPFLRWKSGPLSHPQAPTCRLNSAKSQLQRLHYHRPILTHFYPLPPHFLTLAQSYTNSGSCHTVSLYKFVFPIRCWVPWELEPRINHLLIHISTIFLINSTSKSISSGICLLMLVAEILMRIYLGKTL